MLPFPRQCGSSVLFTLARKRKHVNFVDYVWGVNTIDNIYWCAKPCTGSNWVRVEEHLKQIDAGDEEVWAVNSKDHIYKRLVDGSDHWKLIPGLLKHVSASGNGYIWGVNSDDIVFKSKKPCTTGGWITVDGCLKQIDGGYAYVYGVNSADNIFTRPMEVDRGVKFPVN